MSLMEKLNNNPRSYSQYNYFFKTLSTMVKWTYRRIKCRFDMKYKFSLDKGHFITK